MQVRAAGWFIVSGLGWFERSLLHGLGIYLDLGPGAQAKIGPQTLHLPARILYTTGNAS
jgi:hypothetical protein